jgi:pantetheine-phosphate adenylyltransferase
MNRIAYYPGSFDPLTLGHVDILRQAFGVADEVVMAIGVHSSKQPMFDFNERAALIQSVVDEIGENKRVRVEAFDNLVVDAARKAGATLLVRGVRDGSDLDYELQMAGMNGAMAPQLNTIFFAASPVNRPITATLVRQIISMGGDISSFVPEPVLAMVKKKFG